MQHKKTILFSVIVVSALCFISCGHDSKESIAFSKNTTTQTTFDTKDTNINNTMEILDDDSQGKKSSSRTMASGISMEFFCNDSPLPNMVYGIRSKEEKFTKNTQWDIPSHGDIEYIIIYDASGSLYRVLCWDTDRDKKYVGDSELGESGDNIAEMNWDEVLEKYGFTQGSYTT